MASRDIVAIGTSAGGVRALLYLAERFPPAMPATILVTIHLSSEYPTVLDEILSRAGPLAASFATDGDRLARGRIFIAPPGRHLIVDSDRLRLGVGPRENHARPAIDPMLRSTAVCCGPRSVGVVLTGTLGDGASGLWALNRCGGLTIVQDPSDAAFPEMPQNALDRVTPDHVVPLSSMPALLERLVHQPGGEPAPVPGRLRCEVEIARTGRAAMEEMDRLGRRSVLACPDCHGVMWEIEEGDLLRFRCHVGHTYSADLMSLGLDESLRRAMASALRALEERVFLTRKLEKQAADGGSAAAAASWAARARDCEREMNVIRDAIQRMEQIGSVDAAERTPASDRSKEDHA
jgi:two-component system chemotaxis response regulator CheB